MAFSPTLGRWTQMDPSGYTDGLNPLEFVGSNPTNYRDPTGLKLTEGRTDTPEFDILSDGFLEKYIRTEGYGSTVPLQIKWRTVEELKPTREVQCGLKVYEGLYETDARIARVLSKVVVGQDAANKLGFVRTALLRSLATMFNAEAVAHEQAHEGILHDVLDPQFPVRVLARDDADAQQQAKQMKEDELKRRRGEITSRSKQFHDTGVRRAEQLYLRAMAIIAGHEVPPLKPE